jgi:GT2 family glycosyltransferase
MTNNLTIIVISYNTKELTLTCLKSVYQETKNIHFHLIVVDNNSEDGSADAIAHQFPNLELIKLDKNIGFARANNLAAKRAIGNYILLLNPDTVILDNAIDNLIDFAQQNPKAGIWGGKTLFADGSLNPTSYYSNTTTWHLFSRVFFLSALYSYLQSFKAQAHGKWQHEIIKKVDIVTGCFFLITKELWNNLDGFDKNFFMYGEEADLCLRAKKMGCAPMVTPKATIIHYGGASERVHAEKLNKILAAKVSLIKKHSRPIDSYLQQLLMYLYPIPRVISLGLLSIFNKKYHPLYLTWYIAWKNRDLWIKGNR